MVEGYNVRLKTKEEMTTVTKVIKTPIKTKEGAKTGNFRYRVAGIGSDGTKMNTFVSEAVAKKHSKTYKKPIVEIAAKPKVLKKSKKPCEKFGEEATKKCEVRRKAAVKKRKRARIIKQYTFSE
uniref:Uncharacterized protein n=1 Tax=Marseillevirus LCMAC102 TaxID=2506603 RepID=A0A481YUN9_9VIRU|nr:MAG: hypothetical protein LCMAC102_03960 [Marseillevirus LCMAC102]